MHFICGYAERHYAEYRYAECHYAEHRYAECHYAEHRYAECRGTEYHTTFLNIEMNIFCRQIVIKKTFNSSCQK